MTERGIGLAHPTIRAQGCVRGFEKRWNRYSLPARNSLRVDETNIEVREIAHLSRDR
jgi:transposase-like protein